MNLQPWVTVTVICTAILAVAAVIALAWKVARGMWQRARKEAEELIVALQASSKDFVGVKEELSATRAEVTRLVGRVTVLTEALDEHVTWHDGPGGRPAKSTPPQTNGRPGRRT